MKFIENLEKEVLDDFIKTSPISSFLQTTAWGETLKTEGDCDSYYVGITQNEQLVGVAVILVYRDAKLTKAYTPRGPIIDYTIAEHVEFMMIQLQLYAKKLKVDYLKIEPPLVYKEYNQKNECTTTYTHPHLNILKKLGYLHTGFYVGHYGAQPRYTYILELNRSFDEIKKQFKSDNKTALNKNKQYYHLNVVEKNANNMASLIKLRKALSEVKSFHVKSQTYYQDLYQQLNNTHQAYYFEVSADLDGITNRLEAAIHKNKIEIEKYKTKDNIKAVNKIKDIESINQALNDSIKEIQAFIEHRQERNPVVGVLFNIHINHTVYDLILHTELALTSLKVPVILHEAGIKKAMAMGATYYDFYGVPGIVTHKDPQYGLYVFKKSFGGPLIEYIGDYDYPINKFKYKIIQWIRRLKK